MMKEFFMQSFVLKKHVAKTCCLMALIMGCFLPPVHGEDGMKPVDKGGFAAMRSQQIKINHSRYEILKQDFTSGDEVTKACLSCHTTADEDFRKTIHWTWLTPGPDAETPMGKAGYSINNFCISTNNMNDKSCSACHAGWNGKEGEINCLVCHGQKEFNMTEAFDDLNYFKAESDDESRDMAQEIQGNIKKTVEDIGIPQRKNCGSCHFYGGGGNGVKHGDLDNSLATPSKDLDVHMAGDGGNFTCTRCHTTRMHEVAGRTYTSPASTTRKSLIDDDLMPKITCESCHSSSPHKILAKMNDHTDKVACQTCHIPAFAREKPTKVWWDWSKAGELKDGKKVKTEDYMTIKGEMRWETNVKPEYDWYNGALRTLTLKDTIDPSGIVQVSKPVGDSHDPHSRIFPFKVFRGKQPYDPKSNRFLAPLLSGNQGYWETLDWESALTLGMKDMNLPFSGTWDFVETTSVFPITHMVAPAANALSCKECHSPMGRLAGIGGVYIPGSSDNAWISRIGVFLAMCALLGSLGHGVLRFLVRKGKGI
ncbi:MAG: tetrathionate reductase family octaheme c-type cytochrome [Proteobacteria bacterium]|nr:tetrathionate reductase family octaheme c-type cytochrome [Pseudomonadota bacterium]